VTDEEAVEGFQILARTEGILPALETSHAIAYVTKTARSFGKDAVILVNLSGRGDKDVQTVEQMIGSKAPPLDSRSGRSERSRRAEEPKAPKGLRGGAGVAD